MALARGLTLGIALVHRPTDPERERGQKLLAEVRDEFLRGGYVQAELPIVNVYLARERARHGDRDEAIPLMRTAADYIFRGASFCYGVFFDGVWWSTAGPRADGDLAKPRPR